MIVEALLGLLGSVLSGLLGMIPGYEVQPSSGVGSLLAGKAGQLLGQWLDLGAMFAAMGVVAAAFVGGAAIKGARILISHITGGGGSAA